MVGKQPLNQHRDPISIWRVIVPIEIDREKYIRTCYQTGTVSLTDGNEIVHRVKVGKLSLQLIDFPISIDTFGSEVVCVCAPYSGKLYVIDVYSSSTEINDQRESQFRLYKVSNDGYAEVRVDGQGKVLLTVSGEDEISEVSVNITSENKKGKLKLNVNGDILVQNEGNTHLTSSNNINAKVTDGEVESSVDLKKNEIRLKTPDDGKIYLNDSEEPMLLGNKNNQLLSDILDQLGKESAGPYPLLGQQKYLGFKNRLDEILSKISFVK